MKLALLALCLGLVAGTGASTWLYSLEAKAHARQFNVMKFMLDGMSEDDAVQAFDEGISVQVRYGTPAHYIWLLSGLIYGGIGGLLVAGVLYFARRRQRPKPIPSIQE